MLSVLCSGRLVQDPKKRTGKTAHSWHCNIAMMCHDAIMSDNEKRDNLFKVSNSAAHKIGNDAASRFMKLCFDVETKA